MRPGSEDDEGRGWHGPRALIGGLLAVAAVVAHRAARRRDRRRQRVGEPYPNRQLSIMAPAAPGGGWDTTARAFQPASRDEKLDDGIEVFNVEGAGGTLGLSAARLQVRGRPLPADDDRAGHARRDRDQPLRRPARPHDADRHDDHRDRGDRRADEVALPVAEGPDRRPSRATPARSAGPAARPAAPTSCSSASSRACSAPTRPRRSTSRTPAAARPTRRSSPARSTRASTGLSEVVDQVEARQDAPARGLLAGRRRDRRPQAADASRTQGIDLEMTNWRAIIAPPGLSDAERERIAAWVDARHAHAGVAENVKRYDWTPFVKTGAELDRFVAERAEARAAGRRGPRAGPGPARRATRPPRPPAPPRAALLDRPADRRARRCSRSASLTLIAALDVSRHRQVSAARASRRWSPRSR